MKTQTLIRGFLFIGLIVAVVGGIRLIQLKAGFESAAIPVPQPTVSPQSAEIAPDANTVILDHLNGTSVGEVKGTLNYVSSLPGLDRAGNFISGTYVIYNMSATGIPEALENQGTVELWLNPSEYGRNLITFQWFYAYTPPTMGYVMLLNLTSDGRIYYTVWNPQWGGELFSNSVVPLNRWTHIAVSWGPAGTKIYINGNVDASTPTPIKPDEPRWAYLNEWGNRHLGYVDEVHISKIQRTDAEIRSRLLGRIGTAFTYQGQLKRGGIPVTGNCNLAFHLYDAPAGSSPISPPITLTVPISNGLFTVNLDFGEGVFNGQARWLGIQVQCPGESVYTDLGRQPLTAVPYAVYAQTTQPSILISEDDFDRSTLNYSAATPEWITTTSGLGYVALQGAESRFCPNSGYGGAGSAVLYSNRRFSVKDGMLILKAVIAAYEDNQTCYGDCQPRGLVNGTNRNNAIEFISHRGTGVKTRTVRDGNATETIYFIPGSYPQNSVNGYRAYQIVATASDVRFYLDGILIATHTTNIPTVPLNLYFGTSYDGYGNVNLCVNFVRFEIVPYE